MSLLELEKVQKIRIREDGVRLNVLQGISMALPAGSVTVMVGPSGCGKTTLLRLINRLEEPNGGRILLDGREIALLPPLQLRKKVALVPQKTFMFNGTVQENLQRPFLLRKLTPPPSDHPVWQQTLARLDLPELFLSRMATSLSLGQQQRVGVARALVCEPQVVLLDEPTSALDRPAAERFAQSLRTLCGEKGMTFLVVTHDLWFAERAADHAVFLEAGQIREHAQAGQFFEAPQTDALRRFLLGSEGAGGA